jgi:hypothetical protein
MSRIVHLAIGLAAAALLAGCATAPQDTEEVAAADQGPVTCRETLVPGSNVMEELCLTAEGWERYERRRRSNSQDLLRRMQGMSGAGF